jgi:hypothetical protein
VKVKRRKILRIGGGVAGVLLIYFLSMGPVLRLLVDTRFEPMADKVYSPLLDSGFAWPVVRCYLQVWDLYHPIADSIPMPQGR